MDFQTRKPMPHTRPGWVDDKDPLLLTYCGCPRGLNQFAKDELWSQILAEAHHQKRRGRWSPLLILAMPDHLHIIASIPSRVGIAHLAYCFKSALSMRCDLAWQRDSFDHRIRSDDQLRAKWAYVMMNPVRAGLVPAQEQWPYVCAEFNEEKAG